MMSRTSYGGDLFSPIRSDLSLNDSTFKEEGSSKRGSVTEDLKKVSAKGTNSTDALELPDRRKKNDGKLPLEEVTLRQKNCKIGSTSTKGHEKSVPKSNFMLNTTCVKDENLNLEVPFRQSPRIAKKSQQSGMKEKQTNSKDSNSLSSNKSVSSQRSKKTENDSARNFITFRGRGSRKTEAIGNPAKSCSVNDFATQSEKPEEKENKIADSPESSNEIATDGLSDEIKDISETSVASESLVPSNKNKLLSPMKERTNEIDLKTSSNGEVSEANGDYVGEVLPDGPAGIQIKMIEKLISHSVSDQFDVIRQQMYQHTLCMLKALNETRAEFEERYSRDTDDLHKIIEQLLEENLHLRRAIIARQ